MVGSAEERSLGIERLSVFGMPPVAFIRLAAELGCASVGLSLTPARSFNPHAYPDWSLRTDAALRRQTRDALREHGVGIALMEGFGVGPACDTDEQERDLDLLCELGCGRINVASLDRRDRARSFDAFAGLAAMAGQRHVDVVIEIGPGPVPTISAALDAVAHVSHPNFRLLLDTMHYFRLGGTMDALREIDPALIGYVQLCDAPATKRFLTYMEEALHERMVPGSGDLPLHDVLAWLPADAPISLEIPQRSLALAGLGPKERLAPCVAATRELLAAAAHIAPACRR